ncbi:MAG: nitroreductase family protein [Deltaproteobacteria bacterium]|nr:nitroreductase family protein [Deltaproteobacteria bacterium]
MVRIISIKRVLAVLLAAIVMSAGALLADVQLPAPPSEGGMGLFEALKKRSSMPGGDFSLTELTQAELSAVLWAASGLNRGEQGWTVPMSKGVNPYCRIYVASAQGVWIYDWKTHSLKDVSPDNIKNRLGSQAFVRRASHILIFVNEPSILKSFNDPETEKEFAHVLAGAMTQNIYLAAASLKLGARYIHEMERDNIRADLKLAADEYPICLMLLGK